jgi:hypothetical protein
MRLFANAFEQCVIRDRKRKKAIINTSHKTSSVTLYSYAKMDSVYMDVVSG